MSFLTDTSTYHIGLNETSGFRRKNLPGSNRKSNDGNIFCFLSLEMFAAAS
jgi:hypothetical protein